jgi:D-3-phosphoglycerate dehydrogenase
MVADISHPLTRDVLSQPKNVKVISIYGVGTDTVDLKAAREHNVIVANVPDYGISEVADHTMALALALIRKVPMLDRKLRTLGWGKIRNNIESIKEMFGEVKRLSTLNLGLFNMGF